MTTKDTSIKLSNYYKIVGIEEKECCKSEKQTKIGSNKITWHKHEDVSCENYPNTVQCAQFRRRTNSWFLFTEYRRSCSALYIDQGGGKQSALWGKLPAWESRHRSAVAFRLSSDFRRVFNILQMKWHLTIHCKPDTDLITLRGQTVFEKFNISIKCQISPLRNVSNSI